MQDQETEAVSSGIGESIHKIMTGFISLGVVWMVSTLAGTDTKLQLVSQRLDLLTVSISEQGKDRYSQSDALRDFALRDQLIQSTIQQTNLNTDDIKKLSDLCRKK